MSNVFNKDPNDDHKHHWFAWMVALGLAAAAFAAYHLVPRPVPVRGKSVFESTTRPTSPKLQVEPLQLAPDAGTPPPKAKPAEPRPQQQRHNQAPPRGAYPRPKKLVARR